MLTSKNITKDQIKKVLRLIDEHVRGEIVTRLGLVPIDVLKCAAHEQVRLKDELWELIYGTSDLPVLKVVLGLKDVKPGPVARVVGKRKKKKKRKKRVETTNAYDMDSVMNDILGG